MVHGIASGNLNQNLITGPTRFAPMNKVDHHDSSKTDACEASTSLNDTVAIAQARQTVDRTRSEIEATIAHLEKEADRFRALLDLHLEEITVLKKMRQAMSEATGLHASPIADEQFAPRKRERRQSRAWIVRQTAREILLAKGHPLDSAELLAELNAKGVAIETEQAAKAISKILWAAAEFTSTKRGYWLTGSALPPASITAPKSKRARTKS